MKFIRNLSIKNMKRKPARTAALIFITALLTISLFAGSVFVLSLQRGLKSYEARLGADVIAVPAQSRISNGFESILVQGIPSTFYMKESDYEKIKGLEGVEAAAPEFYLASTTSSCCSVKVQIIGFDPDLDFTVQPWIKESYEKELKTCDLIVGSRLTVPKDRTLKLFDTVCTVVAQMDETGTGLDTAVYANMDTIKLMIENAKKLKFHEFDDVDPEHAVSAVMIKVADGYDPYDVTGLINLYVRRVDAAQAANMLSGISDGLADVSRLIRLLVGAVWLFSVVILVVAFVMIAHERAKEFAMLQTMGASRKMISRMLLTESAAVSAIGAAAGLLVSGILIYLFGNVISARLEMPYLMPSVPVICAIASGAFALTILAGALTSGISAYRMSHMDAALSLREGT